MFSKIILTLAALAVAVSAQDSTSTSSAADATSSALAGISPCVISCVTSAATTNGCAFTDVACVCGSAQFQADAALCLMTNCTPDDLTAALALQTSQCTAAGISPTGTVTTTNVVPFSTATDAATDTTTDTATDTATGTDTAATTTPTSPTGSTTRATTASTGTTRTTGSTTSSAPTTSTTSAANGIAANLAFIGAAIAGLLAL